MRRVRDPIGCDWQVDVEWTGIRFGSEVRGRIRWQQEHQESLADEIGRNSLGLLFRASIIGAGSSLIALAGGLLGIGLIVLAVLLFPWLFVIGLDIALVLGFPLIAIAVITWRVAHHRPFTVLAEHNHTRIATWHAAGIKEARRVEHQIADAIVAGSDPTHLFPEHAARR